MRKQVPSDTSQVPGAVPTGAANYYHVIQIGTDLVDDPWTNGLTSDDLLDWNSGWNKGSGAR